MKLTTLQAVKAIRAVAIDPFDAAADPQSGFSVSGADWTNIHNLLNLIESLAHARGETL